MNKTLKGFTLIELLIVIVIIGILAGVVLSVLNPAKAQRKANESVLKASTEKLCLALYSCAATTASRTNCNVFYKIGVTPPTAPVGASFGIGYVGSTALRITGTLSFGVGSTTSCVYACSYDFNTGVPTNLAQLGTGCLID